MGGIVLRHALDSLSKRYSRIFGENCSRSGDGPTLYYGEAQLDERQNVWLSHGIDDLTLTNA